MFKKFSLGLLLPFLLPVFALAQGGGPSATFGTIGTTIQNFIQFINNILVPLVFALAFLFFIWGLFKYFIYSTEEGKEQGKDLMLWGIIAFVVMVSVWGIVNVVASGLGFREEEIQQIPNVPSNNT